MQWFSNVHSFSDALFKVVTLFLIESVYLLLHSFPAFHAGKLCSSRYTATQRNMSGKSLK